MECCENKNILKDKEMYFCTNCGVIHGYSWIEYDFKFNEYDQNIYNLLKCKNTIYKRKKYLNKKYNLDKRTILFLDESFENIKEYLKLERLPISKYLNIIYQYYCDKGGIEYKPLFKSKIIKLDYRIILLIDESIENIKKCLKFKILPIPKYLDIAYRYYCNKNDIKYKPLFKSKIIINPNIIIISFIEESIENIKKYLELKRFPIRKYVDIVYRYYCNKHNIEYKPYFKSKITKLGNNIKEILDRAYSKYPYIKIEEPLYDFKKTKKFQGNKNLLFLPNVTNIK